MKKSESWHKSQSNLKEIIRSESWHKSQSNLKGIIRYDKVRKLV
jgi:hypothetical protein